jgi:hypothetical protein
MGGDEPPPRFAVYYWAGIRACLVRFTIPGGGGASPLTLGHTTPSLNMPDSSHFIELAKVFFKDMEVNHIPSVRATLHQGDQEIATGSAEVSDSRVMFFPSTPRVLESLLPTPISLKVLGSSSLIPLSESQMDFELSSRVIWFFDRVA